MIRRTSILMTVLLAAATGRAGELDNEFSNQPPAVAALTIAAPSAVVRPGIVKASELDAEKPTQSCHFGGFGFGRGFGYGGWGFGRGFGGYVGFGYRSVGFGGFGGYGLGLGLGYGGYGLGYGGYGLGMGYGGYGGLGYGGYGGLGYCGLGMGIGGFGLGGFW